MPESTVNPPILIIWSLALIVAVIAGVIDWRSHRIPNWLTVPSLLLGIVANSVVLGFHGTKLSLEGAGLCLIALLPVVLVRGLGAGDWKLMGALGAFLGPYAVLVVLFVAVMIGGIMAVVQMVSHRRVKQTLTNLWFLLSMLIMLKFKAHEQISIDSPNGLKLPFGVATALSTVLCFGWVGIGAHIVR
ncbi:MAG TPA: A24 family peptidase [Terriglobales bacterium]|nr:A24 family peptidase [Terriglobales bacterium]